MTLECKLCADKVLTYTGLERSAEAEAEGFVWSRDLPDRFECKCGKSTLSLVILKNNLHAYLGTRGFQSGEEISATRVYEPSALQTIMDQLIHLLDKNPKEELVQKFFEAHTVLLHQFSPARISIKPPTLRKFADFAVLSKNGHLRLVELERPSKKIIRKDGGRTAGFTQACDQVLTWQHEFRDHRIAILEKLNLSNAEVTKVSGVVIMGRDSVYDRNSLLRL
jgi:hypothetical protein